MKCVGLFLGILLSASFAQAIIKDCTRLKEKCFSYYNLPNQGFIIHAPGSKKVAILSHGLSDSPYFTKDLALILNSQGYNVYSVLLTGHGTQVEELFQIHRRQWLTDIEKTMLKAMRETGAEKVVLGGFSMGGALMSEIAASPVWKLKVSNLILMAPAFQVRNSARMMCATGISHLKPWAWNKNEFSTVKYNKMTFKAVCELVELGSEARKHSEQIQIPVFLVVTDGDVTVDTEAAINVYKNMPSKKKAIYHIKDKEISHTDINFKTDPIHHRNNPQFDHMAQKIIKFIR